LSNHKNTIVKSTESKKSNNLNKSNRNSEKKVLLKEDKFKSNFKSNLSTLIEEIGKTDSKSVKDN